MGGVGICAASMKYNPDKHHRRSIRLKNYDYSSSGFYFITICTYHRLYLFGDIEGGEMNLNKFGEIVADCWQAIPDHFNHIETDAFVVMPNHIHGILAMTSTGRDMAPPCPTQTHNRQFSRPIPGSISTIVGSFKSIATRRINAIRRSPGCPVWQSRFYDRIIRDQESLERVRHYIRKNPLAWQTDRLRSGLSGHDGG